MGLEINLCFSIEMHPPRYKKAVGNLVVVVVVIFFLLEGAI